MAKRNRGSLAPDRRLIWAQIIHTDGVMHPDKQTIAKLLKWYGNICIYGAADWWKKMSKDEPMDVCKHVQYEKGEYVWRAEKL